MYITTNGFSSIILVLLAVSVSTGSEPIIVDDFSERHPISILSQPRPSVSPLPLLSTISYDNSETFATLGSSPFMGQSRQSMMNDELHAPGTKRQCSGAACVGTFNEDPDARADFRQKVGGVVKDMMEQEIKKFVDNMSETAMGQLTDQLLSFTLMGQRYLCLNIVCSPSNSPVQFLKFLLHWH